MSKNRTMPKVFNGMTKYEDYLVKSIDKTRGPSDVEVTFSKDIEEDIDEVRIEHPSLGVVVRRRKVTTTRKVTITFK